MGTADPLLGRDVELDVGPVAHGGHCVARLDGRVVFVRHALPGERVRARVTEGEVGDAFLRADTVEVLRASPDRMDPRCRYAGWCGGCDFQHVTLPAQRALKETVVREQMSRLAGTDLPEAFCVEAVPGDVDGLGWRTRLELTRGADGRLGMRRHRSHDVVPIESCPLAHPRIGDLRAAPDDETTRVTLGVSSTGQLAVVGEPLGERAVPALAEHVAGARFTGDFEVSLLGFWQVHPGAAAALVDAVLDALEPRPGERALDLYAGVGLFAAALAGAVGPTGQVVAVESDAVAADQARTNLAAYGKVAVVTARVDDAFGVPRPRRRGSAPQRASRQRRLTRSPLVPQRADLVVLDPPRTGAGGAVVEAVAALGARGIAHVACDPAALARDTAHLAGAGYRLVGLRALDLFPMTHHVECVAHFEPDGAR